MLRKIKWNKDCRMGNELIDSQHRLLFAIANELLEIENTEDEAVEFRYLFAHLRNYVEQHFVEEEELMARYNYPELENHAKKHKQIVAEINDTIKASPDLNKLRNNLYYMFDRWIKMHILQEDKELFKWLNSPKRSKSTENTT